MAEEVGPDGQRTLGVLTKPDFVDKDAEKAVIDLIEGSTTSAGVGRCLVRNPGQPVGGPSDGSARAREKLLPARGPVEQPRQGEGWNPCAVNFPR